MVIPPLQGQGIWRMILQRILRSIAYKYRYIFTLSNLINKFGSNLLLANLPNTSVGCGLFHLNISLSWICITHAPKLNKAVSKRIASMVISVLLKSRSLRMSYQIVFYCCYRHGRSSFVLFSLLEVVILLMC
ncbi:hypothetical protein Hanom_Chr09g00789241 [Helianthus anomalus]